MTTKQLIESICLMFCVWSLRLAFLAAGCWMMWNGWFGCGMTTIVLTVLICWSHHGDDEEDDDGKPSE